MGIFNKIKYLIYFNFFYFLNIFKINYFSRKNLTMAPKIDKSNFYFRRKENQTLQKMPGSLNGSDFAIANCTNCEIYIFDYLA